MLKKTLSLLFAVTLFVGSFANAALAADYPQRPIRMILSSAPGGGTDQWGRAVCAAMEKLLGNKITLNNMVGAGGATGSVYVWNAAHDGYSWVSANDSNPAAPVMTGLKETLAKNWTFYIAGGSPGVLCVNKQTDMKNVEELLARVKNQPTSMTLASCAGSVWFSQASIMTGPCGLHVGSIPIAGTRPAIISCVSGETNMVIASIGEVADFIKAGTLIPVFMMQDEEYTLDGHKIRPVTHFFPAYKPYLALKQWQGIMIPNDVPEEVKSIIESSFKKAMASEEVKGLLERQCGILYNITGPEALKYAEEVEQITSWLLHDLGIAQHSPEALGIPKK